MMVRRSALPYGSGLRRTALTTLKIAVLAPIPRARVMIAVRANAGFLRSVLAPSARSRDRVGIVLDQVVGRRPMGTARIALVDSILDRRVAPYKKDYALINPTDLTQGLDPCSHGFPPTQRNTRRRHLGSATMISPATIIARRSATSGSYFRYCSSK